MSQIIIITLGLLLIYEMFYFYSINFIVFILHMAESQSFLLYNPILII